VLLGATVAARRERPAAWRWALLTLGWFVLQGVFGALTVTWKLYPAVVTAHLLGGMGLLALLAVQAAPGRAMGGGDAERGRGTGARTGAGAVAAAEPDSDAGRGVSCTNGRDRLALTLAAVALVAQIALGGWVSTNYAVLACAGFPQCNGRWWPAMDWADGFTLLRELGRRADGQWIPMSALVAIQIAHRLFAIVATVAVGWLAARLMRGDPASRRRGAIVAALLALQLATGLSNVVLGWPLAAALLHTAGAAALVVCLGREAALAWAGRRRRRDEHSAAADAAVPRPLTR
jgi:cytochrome c oxidase assembly protein subunit 15